MIRPTILWALSLAMLGGGLFGLAFSLRPPAGRAYPGAFRRLPAEREARSLSLASRFGVAGDGHSKRPSPPLTSGEGECGHGSTHRAPSPVSYALGLRALERVTDRVASVHGGTSSPAPRRWSTPCDRPEATR